MPTVEAPTLDPGMQRQLASDLFNRVWTLLGQEDRTALEEAEMIHASLRGGPNRRGGLVLVSPTRMTGRSSCVTWRLCR